MRVVEFYGGPGIGKSACAMATALALKLGHEQHEWPEPLSVEYVPEFAAEQVRGARLVGGDPRRALGNQLLLAGTQLHYLERLACDGVQIAVCDSPLWLCAVYAQALDRYPDGAWRDILRAHYERPLSTPRGPEPVEVLPVLLTRVERHYNSSGRVQEIAESKELDTAIAAVAICEWGRALVRVEARASTVPGQVIAAMRKRGWLTPVCETVPAGRSLGLAEVNAGAERAAARVDQWPKWKQEVAQPDRSWLYCEHANESPNVCPCPQNCPCRQHSCTKR